MPNSTSSLQGWVDQPNTRGTFDIVQSSFLTIFLCTWTCLHLNLPAANEGTLKPILRKFRWMILTILGPEFVATLAAGQRANAKRVRDQFYEIGHKQWTLRHSFYANMGGFVLQPRDSTPFPIHGLHLIYLVKKGYISLPSITEDEIADKSKANWLAKALVCLQIGWFVVQCLGRWHGGLPLTSLELTTTSYVWCTWGIYAQWLHKPLDVAVPTILKSKASTAEILLQAGPEAATPYRQTPLDFVFDGRHSWTLDVQPFLRFRVDPRKRPMPRVLNDSFPWFSTAADTLIIVFIVIFYGVILAFGWNFVFPTAIEKLLWRISALVVVGTTAAFVLWETAWGIFRAAYLLHLNKKRMSPRFIYYVYAAKPEKVDPVGRLPIHNQNFDGAVVTGAKTTFIIVYISIYADVLDADVYSSPPALNEQLPPFPPGIWNKGLITKAEKRSEPHFAWTRYETLPGITSTWHKTFIDYHLLTLSESLMPNVYEASHPEFGEVVAKFARFQWEIDSYQAETEAYGWIEGQGIGPRFLGHLTEEGRVIGFVIKKLEGRHACVDDMATCMEVVHRLHYLGILHGDLNQHNFIVQSDGAALIDFETCIKSRDRNKMTAELQGLERELLDNPGKGG
ncbi:MAG: hypothetical protein Q9218_001185 [Villophora microphyllina]